MNFGKKTLDAVSYIEENDIKFIRMQFCDIYGQSKNIAISNEQIERAILYGVPFDANSVAGCLDADHSDLILHPDLSTLQILPWRPQQGKVARILCDVKYPDGTNFEGDSRYILKEQMKKAEKLGYRFNVGAECEFFLFRLGENGEPTREPVDDAGYFDLAPFDRGENTRREIILTLEEMGFEIESSHHESARGQHEIDFKYSSALESADNIMTFKTVVKTIAQRNGLHATFMPKPLNGQPGSGMHINMSLMRDGENIFTSDFGGLTDEARWFAAGVLGHIRGISAVSNPLVNSYKRLMDGYEAPQTVSWGYGSRSPLIRIPAAVGDYCRMELRSPDPACNPYLTFALVLAAGLEGIEKKLTLMDPLGEAPAALQKLPMTLREALGEMEKDTLVAEVLGEKTTQKYIQLKSWEWRQYIGMVHEWEIDRYFSTF